MAAYNIRSTLRSVKNAVLQYSDIEVKVREATNNDRWGVSTTALAEIARATNDYEEYPKLFAMTWKRLNDHEHVMHVQKALILIDYLLRNGAERFISDAKRRTKDIQQLTKYKHYDPNTQRDDAGEARTKAKLVYELLTNDAKLTEERAKAQAIRDLNLGGMSNEGDVTDGRADYEKNYDAVPPRKAAAAAANGFDERTDDDWSKEAPPPVPATITAGKKGADGEKKKKKKKKVTENGDGAAATPAPPTPPQSAMAAPTAAGATSPTNFGGSFDFDAVANGADPFGSSAPTAPTKTAAAPSAALSGAAPGEKTKRKKKGASAATSAAATPATAPQTAGGDFDLTNFAGGAASDHTHNADIDMLTGAHVPVGGSLVDTFAASSLMDEPIQRTDDDDGFEEEPALLDTKPSHHTDTAAVSGSAGEKADTKSDAWDLASDLANLDNIKADPNKKKAANNKMEVSMSMMRGMQIGGSSSSAPSRPSAPPPSNAFFPPVGAAPMMQPQMMQPNMFAVGGIPNFGMQMGMAPPQQQQPQSAFGGDLPFAATPGAPSRKSNKPILFDSVPAARPDVMAPQPGAAGGPKGPNWNR